MDLTPFAGLFLPVSVVAAAAVANVAVSLRAHALKAKQTQLAAIEAAIGHVSGGIASELMSVQASTPAAALSAIKQAAVGQGAATIATILPGAMAAAGVTQDALATLLSGAVGGKLVAAATPAMLSAAAPSLLAAAAAALLPPVDAAAAAPDAAPVASTLG